MSHPTSGRALMRSEPKDETKAVAGRVFGEYRAACTQLEPNAAEEIAALASNVLADAPEAVRKSPRDAVFWALLAAYTTASDESASPVDRRQCFVALTAMLERIDKIKGQPSWRQACTAVVETRPAVETLSPEHRAVLPMREEGASARSEAAVRGNGRAASHDSLENSLPQKRPAASQASEESVRGHSTLNGETCIDPQRPRSPSPLVTSPLRRATSPSPVEPPPTNRAPVPAKRPNSQTDYYRSGASDAQAPSLKEAPRAPPAAGSLKEPPRAPAAGSLKEPPRAAPAAGSLKEPPRAAPAAGFLKEPPRAPAAAGSLKDPPRAALAAGSLKEPPRAPAAAAGSLKEPPRAPAAAGSLKEPHRAPVAGSLKERDVPPAPLASKAVRFQAASESTKKRPPEEALRHALGSSDPGAGRREMASARSADPHGTQPGSLPKGHLKPPPGQQSTDPASTAPLLALTELRKARDPPKSGRSSQDDRQSAPNATTGGAAAREDPKRSPRPTSYEDSERTSASRSRSPDRSASLSVPRRAAASLTAATATSEAHSSRAQPRSTMPGDSHSLRMASGSLKEPPEVVMARLASEAGSNPRSDRPGQESGNRPIPVAAAAASRSDSIGGHDREALVPRREREQAVTAHQGREQSTRNGASRSRASSNAKSDLMYLCLQRYGSNETIERTSFVAQPDTNRFSGALEDRDRVTLELEQKSVTTIEALAMMDRLQRWDPFWEFTGPVMIGKLGRILAPILETPPPEGTALNEAYKAKAAKLAKSGKLLRTAMRLVFTPNTDLKPHDERDVFKLIPFPSWHNPQRTTFEDGEAHLILRMLPCNPPTQGSASASSYRSRVDCHTWPKGTYLQHNGVPVKLRQRKMDRVNRTWKHSDPKELHVLDLTPRIQDPRTEQVLDLCCYDDEPFLYCLSICKYRCHESLYRSLTSESSPERLETIPYDAGLARIIELAKPVLLDGVEETGPGSDNFAHFSLLCPIAKKIMSHPVRGRRCHHFQCFDLKSFLEMNTPPTAARWRCGVLDCNRFLSVRDLVSCQLTKETLREVRSKIAPDQHRMQFDTAGMYRLIREEAKDKAKAKPPPPPQRQAAASSSSSSSTNRPPPGRKDAPVMETIDLGLL